MRYVLYFLDVFVDMTDYNLTSGARSAIRVTRLQSLRLEWLIAYYLVTPTED